MHNAHAFNHKTKELQDDHRQLGLTVRLYTDVHPELVYNQPLTENGPLCQ